MILERVIGNTIKGKHGMAIDPTTGDLAYIAGCVVVFYRPKHNRQTQFLSSLNNRWDLTYLVTDTSPPTHMYLLSGRCPALTSLLMGDTWLLERGRGSPR